MKCERRRLTFFGSHLCPCLFEEKRGEAIKKLSVTIGLTFCIVCVCTMVFANPGMLPVHPAYPMSATKFFVTGQFVANDPGEAPPRVEESLKQASA